MMEHDAGNMRKQPKPRSVLTQTMAIKADKVIKENMVQVDEMDNIWRYKEGWDDQKVADAIGEPDKVKSIGRLRIKICGKLRLKGQAAAEPELPLAKSKKDVLRDILDRLDKIEAAVSELAAAFR